MGAVVTDRGGGCLNKVMNTSSSSSSSLVLLLERAGVLESHEGGDPAQYKLVGLVFNEGIVFSGSSGLFGVVSQIPYLATVVNRNCEGLVQSDLWLLGMNGASVKGDHSR